MKTTITVSVKGQKLMLTNQPVIAAGGVDEDCIKFSFDDTWDGFDKTAVFYRTQDEVYHCVLVDDSCVIPYEVLTTQGDVYFGVFGKKDGITRTSLIITFAVSNGAFAEGIAPADPTPDIYAQILSVANNAVDVAESVRADADAGKFDGITPHIGENGNWWIGDTDTGVFAGGTDIESGADGGYYTPSVSTEGVLTWSASKEGMPPIPSSVVKGDTGATGSNGADGVSPTVAVSKSGKVTTITITDANGKKTATINDGADGAAGSDGNDGVGIKSVVQTTTSNADGGINVVTVTKTDGTTSTFAFKNGSKGSTGGTGNAGADGFGVFPCGTNAPTISAQPATVLINFFHLPSGYTLRVGDMAVCANGYLAKVTAISGSDVTLTGTGICIKGADGSGNSITIDSELSDTSENPVQNKVIAEVLYTAGEAIAALEQEVESLKENGGSGGVDSLIGTTETITPADVNAALAEGRQVVLTHTEEGLGEVTLNSFAVIDDEMIGANATITMDGVAVNITLLGSVTEGAWSFAFTQLPSVEALNPYLTPAVTTDDNGKILQVVDGVWTAVAMTDVSEVGM